MILQATVPNTYAATKASLACWRERAKVEFANDNGLNSSNSLICECGNRRLKTKLCCATCEALDSGQDTEELDRAVLAVFDDGEELSRNAVVEALAYQYAGHMVYRSLLRSISAGKVARHCLQRNEGFLYRRVEP